MLSASHWNEGAAIKEAKTVFHNKVTRLLHFPLQPEPHASWRGPGIIQGKKMKAGVLQGKPGHGLQQHGTDQAKGRDVLEVMGII